MKTLGKTTGFGRFCVGALLLAVLLAPLSVCLANGHREEGRYHKHSERGRDGMIQGLFGRGHDQGNEATGQIVAWSLAAANLTVALSLIIRSVRRFAPLGANSKQALAKFNSKQKKYLMKFHYVLNPLILLLAILHWTLSRCKSTALPEWGLLTMGTVVVLGIVLKFKLCPKPLLRNIYRVHTQPVLLLLLISMLLVGHLAMD